MDLDLRLVDKRLSRRLMDLLMDFGTMEPGSWQRHIVINNSNWNISFDKWEFIKETYEEKIKIHSVSVDLPIAEDEIILVYSIFYDNSI